MSMKNRVLLHKAGRDQYGNKGSPPLPTYNPSQKDEERTIKMRSLHVNRNKDFIQTYSAQWLPLFKGMSIKAMWEFLHPNKRPSYSTFYKRSKDYGALDAYSGPC